MTSTHVRLRVIKQIQHGIQNHPLVLLNGPPVQGELLVRLALQELVSLTEEDQTLLKEGTHSDFTSYDARTMSKEDARELREHSTPSPTRWNFRVLIINHFDRLSRDAVQVLLKLFEDPPEKTRIITTSRSAETLLATIRSRAITIDIPASTDTDIREWLTEQKISDVDFRVEASPGDPTTALEMDVTVCEEWKKIWITVLSGSGLSPLFVYSWSSRFESFTPSTQVAMWQLFIQQAVNRIDRAAWIWAAFMAIQERERVLAGHSNKLWVSTTLAEIFGCVMTDHYMSKQQ